MARSEVSSNVSLDYVRTARAKGMSNRSVIFRHILRNSMIPVVTYLGQDLGALMGGAMITEQIFMNSGFLRSVRHASDHMLAAGADSSTVSTVCSGVSSRI